MLQIKVLGSGCPNCQKVAEIARQAAANLGVAAGVEKVTDPEAIRRYNLLATPGLVVGGQLVAAGRIPDVGEVTTWIVDALEAV